MKKIFTALFFGLCVFGSAQAQTAASAMDANGKKVMTKAEKDAAKAKKEADLVEAFTKADLSADQQAKSRSVLDVSNENARPIKADAALSEDDKKAKLEEVYKERNDALKLIMGDAKYKIFKATQKAQKEAAGAGQ